MNVIVRELKKEDIAAAAEIWNTVVEEKNAFPQLETLTLAEAEAFFAAQSFCGVAEADGEIVGIYILHPNNIGRCGHLCNASYAVKRGKRGMHIGEQLVRHCMQMGKALGFRVLQFNAVVQSNTAAIKLYEKLGFTCMGSVPGGFLNGNGEYEDICLFYHVL